MSPMRTYLDIIKGSVVITEDISQLRKADGSEVNVYDLYMAANQLSSAYHDPVGNYLQQAAQALYQAYTALQQGQQQNPSQGQPQTNASPTSMPQNAQAA